MIKIKKSSTTAK